jgi:uncharacterized protein YbjT (DUF2867 family)
VSAPPLLGLRVGVVGAGGYVGRRLVPALAEAGAHVRAIARRGGAIAHAGRGEVAVADALDRPALERAVDGLDVVVWLVHSLGAGRSFPALDRRAAENAATVAARRGVRRIVYLGGLGDDRPELSRHLRSRRETARILAGGDVPVTTLRAGMVIGAESASFRMLRDMVRRLPVMVTPRWVENRTQPIAERDVCRYLVGCAGEPRTAGRDFDVGGPDVLSYQEMMERTARLMGRRAPVVVPVPVLSPELSSRWAGLVTAVDRRVARPLIEGLRNETVCRDDAILALVPGPRLGFDDAVRDALGLPASA